MRSRTAPARDRAAVQVASSRPRSEETLVPLLDTVVGDLVGRGLPATAALMAAGRAVAGTSWDGYRNGRNRLATMAAAYLHWISPGSPWQFTGSFEVGGRQILVWESVDGCTIVDLLDVTGSAQALIPPTFGACAQRDGFVGVRLVRLEAPMTSLFYKTPHSHELLAKSPYWFEVDR